MQGQTEIRKGMTARSREGDKLGTIVDCASDGFTIERGLFFPKDYRARYEDVVDVRETDVFLSKDKDSLVAGRADDVADDLTLPGPSTLPDPVATGQPAMTLSEEQLSAEKHTERAGEVRIVKEIVSEQRQIDVSVSHEEVRVEQVPLEAARPAGAGEAEFARQEISIPVYGERVEVTKTPVVTGEVRVSKRDVTEEQSVSGEVRKEVADIRKEGDVKDREVPPG